MADTLAASLALVGVALVTSPPATPLPLRRLLLGALALGASAAAKPDHALLLAFLAWPLWSSVPRGRSFLGVAAIALAWAAFGLSALAAGCGGLEPALHEGLRFLGGHLGDWGGLQESSPRVVYALAPLGDFAPWGGDDLPALAIRLASALALGAAALRAPRWLRRAFVLGAAPYAAWFLFGQTLSHPRHALVLIPLLSALAARGLPHTRGGRALALLLLSAALGATALRAPEWREGARPADRLARWLEEAPPRSRLYAGGSARALQHRLPARDVRRVRDLAGLEDDLGASPLPPAAIYVLPEVLGAPPGPPLAWEEIRRAR